MSDIHRLLDEAFTGVVMTPELQDLKEELRGNLASVVGTLREIKARDTTGREISTFVGEPRAWMAGFSGSRRQLVGIRQAGA